LHLLARPAARARCTGMAARRDQYPNMKKTGYESDTTKFIREFLDKNPQVIEKQKKARATWWDKPHALEDLKREQETKVPQTGYVYYNNP
jgi:hypothetical protein